MTLRGGNVGSFGILFVLALRGIFTHKLKSLVVGFLMFFGTALVTTGTALLRSIEDSMSKSITSSLAGHLQLYSATAKDELALFGGMIMGRTDIGRIPNFEELRPIVEGIDNVKAVIPMGIDIASVTGGNEFDRVIDDLRKAVAVGSSDRIAGISAQISQMARELRDELELRLEIAAEPERVREDLDNLKRVIDPSFWGELDRNPEQTLSFLETKIASLTSDGKLLYLRYVGTDLDRFRENFDRFQIVKGEAVPPNHRGFLFADKYYEDYVKNKVARDFDKIHRIVRDQEKRIADDDLLKTLVAQNARQYRRITSQLDPEERVKLRAELLRILPKGNAENAEERTIEQLLETFLSVDDVTLQDRYAFFYEVIAPMIELYQVRIGDIMTVRAFTQSGYLKAVNIKVYGSFTFRGLERADLAAAANLMDIVTFRDLYGLMSEARRTELSDLRKGISAREISRDTAEDELFGKSPSPLLEPQATDGGAFDEFSGLLDGARVPEAQGALEQGAFDRSAVDRGVAIHAAVVLKDPARLEETARAIRDLTLQHGMDLKVANWQEASGIVGQFVIVIRLVLYVAIGIIFLVALVIINNTMLMATMERTAEIGTMRAIGAQRSYIMWMFLFETAILGVFAGGLGAFGGAGIVAWLGHVGIPAGTQDVLIFLFGGPRLHPSVAPENLLFASWTVLAVSFLSTLYPARLATRIQPVVAMQSKE